MFSATCPINKYTASLPLAGKEMVVTLIVSSDPEHIRRKVEHNATQSSS
jgi:hypothetical protein